MNPSKNAGKLKELIEQAIADNELTHAEMDQITNLATEDGIVDSEEQALLDQLHDMIENKLIKVVP